jgi:flagellar protein FliO/FliZ
VSTLSLAGLLGRLVVSLAVVLGLMLLAAWVIRRRGGLLPSKSPFTVLARQPLTRSASLQVVSIGDRALVLGVTEENVTLIAEADLDLFVPLSGPGGTGPSGGGPGSGSGDQRTVLPDGGTIVSSGPAWKASLGQLKERSTRR